MKTEKSSVCHKYTINNMKCDEDYCYLDGEKLSVRRIGMATADYFSCVEIKNSKIPKLKKFTKDCYAVYNAFPEYQDCR